MPCPPFVMSFRPAIHRWLARQHCPSPLHRLFQLKPTCLFEWNLLPSNGNQSLICLSQRILIPAAQAGCVVTGLDQSKNMLARCSARADALSNDARDRITLVEGDVTRVHLCRTFKLAIAPFRPIQHLTTVGEQLSFLRCVREHLDPGGRWKPVRLCPPLARAREDALAENARGTPTFNSGRRLCFT